MTATINLEELARICAGRMLNSMLEGIAIGLFAWILLRLVGRRSSSTRFAVWFSALLAIAFLPVLGRGAPSPGSSPPAVTVPGSWAIGVFVVWAVLASVALLRVGVGLLQLQELRRSCSALDTATLDPVLCGTLQRFQAVRPVALCQSNLVQVPTAIGFLKPLVVIPTWTLQEFSTPELNSILIHELAHLRRWDDWTNLAQQVLKALLFFHPAVWWIEDKLALEREMACDDAVLAETANPKDYAQCLVSIAEKSFMRRGLAMAQAVVNRVRQTSLRVTQILDVNRSSATRVWKPALCSVAAFSVVCLVSLSHAPELVAFEARMPEVTVASATPANEMLTSAAAENFIEKQAVAAPLIFHPESSPEPHLQTPRIKESNAMATEKSGFWVAQRFQHCDDRIQMNSGCSPKVTKVSVSATSALVSQEAENRPGLQPQTHRVREGTSSIVPQTAENKSGLQPLRREMSVQPNFSADASAGLTDSKFKEPTPDDLALAKTPPFIEDDVVPQTIFVVMHSEEYRQAGPMLWKLSVWRVVVFDSSHIPVETRIPAKQI